MHSPAKSDQLHPTIPFILCPRCAVRMPLATVEPELNDTRERMTFVCDCGFDYRESHPLVAQEIARAA